MKFYSVSIKNFRNFEDIEIKLANKNVLFGMNDIGKTNFLYALRYVFDKDIRKQNFTETDYYQMHTDTPIEITLAINIQDVDNLDTQKIRARLRGAIRSSENTVYIKLIGKYDSREAVGIPILMWGGDLDNLEEMKVRGIYYEIDHIFNPIYIDAYVDLYALFRKNAKTLLPNEKEQDEEALERIHAIYDSLNKEIASLSGVKSFEDEITPEYRKYRNENVSISVKSEIAVRGLYSNIIPYIKNDSDEALYPTSGEGRKKLLVYSIYNLLSAKHEVEKINLFLIEEPENHLHRSLQISLSQILFQEGKYTYLFLTTHSPYILSEIDNINLVRIYNADKIISKSAFYIVPAEFKKQRKMLNKGLAEAIFADKVLLVEGPSEDVLFSKVLSVKNPFYEANGLYILPVNGFGFKPYHSILNELGISNIIKTDNDLKKVPSEDQYSVLGFSRVNGYLDESPLPVAHIIAAGANDVEAKRALYEKNKEILDKIRSEHSIYLSRCSLEEDLDEVIHDGMVAHLPDAKGNPVKYLQSAKNFHMVELVQKLTDEECNDIYEHYNFACLKEALE